MVEYGQVFVGDPAGQDDIVPQLEPIYQGQFMLALRCRLADQYQLVRQPFANVDESSDNSFHIFHGIDLSDVQNNLVRQFVFFP
jgi:hypothetical protein